MKTLIGKILYLNRLAFAKERGASIHIPKNLDDTATYSYGWLNYIYLYCTMNGKEIETFRIPFENGRFNFSELQYYLVMRNMKMCPPIEYLELFLWKKPI